MSSCRPFDRAYRVVKLVVEVTQFVYRVWKIDYHMYFREVDLNLKTNIQETIYLYIPTSFTPSISPIRMLVVRVSTWDLWPVE